MATRLGRSVFADAKDADLAIRGSIELANATTTGGRWRVTVQLSTRDGVIVGSRSLTSEASDCRSLDDSIVLVIALLLDSDADPEAAADAPKMGAEATVLPPHAAVPDDTPRNASPGWRGAVYAGGAWSAGLVPGLAVGPVVGGRVGPAGGPALRVHAAYWPRRAAQDDAGKQARVEAAHGGISYSPVIVSRAWLSWELGPRLDFGALWARGLSFAPNEGSTGLLLLGLAQSRLDLFAGAWVFSSSVAVGTPLLHPKVTYDPGDGAPVQTIFEVGGLLGLVEVTVGFRSGGS